MIKLVRILCTSESYCGYDSFLYGIIISCPLLLFFNREVKTPFFLGENPTIEPQQTTSSTLLSPLGNSSALFVTPLVVTPGQDYCLLEPVATPVNAAVLSLLLPIRPLETSWRLVQ